MCLNTGEILSLSQEQKQDSPVFQFVFTGLLQEMLTHQDQLSILNMPNTIRIPSVKGCCLLSPKGILV